jgi:hypothetical protein
MTPDKKVKILATLGPAIDGIDDIRELVEAGVNIFRLNFSHGDHADHAQRYQWIREVERQLNYPLGILMDLQGPKLRVGKFADGKVQLHAVRPCAWTWTPRRAMSAGSTCRTRRSSPRWSRAWTCCWTTASCACAWSPIRRRHRHHRAQWRRTVGPQRA